MTFQDPYGGDLISRKPNGPTKRERGDVWVQLGVSACVLLLPPLGLAAGVMVFGRFVPQDPEYAGAAQQAPASQTTVTKSVALAQRSDPVTDFTLASAEQHPIITEQPAASAQHEASAQPSAAKDPTRYYGAIPVTLVHIRKSSEPSAMAGPPSTVAAADAAVAATSRISDPLIRLTGPVTAFPAAGPPGAHLPLGPAGLDLGPSLLLQFLHSMLLVIGDGCGKWHGARHPHLGQGYHECFSFFRWNDMAHDATFVAGI